MNTKPCLTRLAILFAISLTMPFVTAQDAKKLNPVPLAHEDSDIKTDGAVTWGLLDNGMRFAILPNAEPPNRVSMRLYVDAGSVMEADNQQGLAHFLEHMAFNGTTNFPPGEMVEYFQRLGMGFGNHTNAHTSFHETVYKLEMPNTKEETLDEGFTLLRDYADGMKLLPDEIENERGIILSEKRNRDSVSWRTFVDQMKFAFPDSLISNRMPIGTEEVIKKAPRERFVEFYENWYTPNRMVLIIVGDIEVANIEKMIDKHFKDLPWREKRPEPNMGKLSKRDFATNYHYEEEAGEASVSIETLKTRVDPPDNAERRAHDLRLMLASQMLRRRLERIAKREDAPISSANTHSGDFFDLNFALYGSIDADCKPENWDKAMALIEQELRRAIQHGFTDAELSEVKANILNSYEEAAKQMSTRKSRSLADSIVSRLGSRRVFTNPKEDLPRVDAELKTVTTEQCRELFGQLWNDADERLALVSGNAVIENPDAAITKVYEASVKVEVAAPEEKELDAFAYSELPDAGKVAKRDEIEDLEVTQLRFENNVRVNLKVTDFEDEKIHIQARIGGGLLTEPKDKAGLSFFTSSTFSGAGLEAHNDDELKQLFAGQSVGVGFSVADDAFVIGGTTNSEDLTPQLELMRAYITNPGYRKEAATEFKRALDYVYQQLERTPGGYAQDKVARFLHSDDPRFGYPDRAKVDAFTMEDAKAWLANELAKGYMEVTIVGDFDKEKMIEELGRTLGNLPERDLKKPPYTKERLVKFPAKAQRTFEFDSEIPKAMTVVHWPTVDIYDIKKSRRLGMLGAIIDDRLRIRIREELGDAYSPFAHNIPSDTWKDYGYLFASVTVDPAQAESVGAVVSDIAKELSTGEAITEDELDRAKKPQVVQIEEMRRTNRYWLGSVLESSQEYPQRIEWSRTFVDDYKDITVEEVNALAAEFLKEDAQVTVIVKPAEKVEEEKEKEKKE